MKLWLGIILSFGLCGCLPTIQGGAKYASKEIRDGLKNSCRELESIGDHKDLMSQIRLDMTEINGLLKENNLVTFKSRLLFLGKRIKQSTDRLIQISNPKFSQAFETQRIQWVIRFSRPEVRLWLWGPGWHVARLDIEDVYTQEGKNLLGPENFNTSILNDRALVTLNRAASLLDICQFQQTIGLVVKLTLRNGENSRTLKYILRSQNEGLL